MVDISAGIDRKVEVGERKRPFYFDFRYLYFDRLSNIDFSQCFLSWDLLWLDHGEDSILIDHIDGNGFDFSCFYLFNWIIFL